MFIFLFLFCVKSKTLGIKTLKKNVFSFVYAFQPKFYDYIDIVLGVRQILFQNWRYQCLILRFFFQQTPHNMLLTIFIELNMMNILIYICTFILYSISIIKQSYYLIQILRILNFSFLIFLLYYNISLFSFFF